MIQQFSPENSVIIIRVFLVKSAVHADTVMGDYHDMISNETSQRDLHIFTDNTKKKLPSGVTSDYRIGKPVILEFSVEDHGLGIPKDAQPLLFRRFMQFSDSKHRTSGSGG
jgi:signal transduction histidine kinase